MLTHIYVNRVHCHVLCSCLSLLPYCSTALRQAVWVGVVDLLLELTQLVHDGPQGSRVVFGETCISLMMSWLLSLAYAQQFQPHQKGLSPVAGEIQHHEL